MRIIISRLLLLLFCSLLLSACFSLESYFEEILLDGSADDEPVGDRIVSKNPGPAPFDVEIYRVGGIDKRVKEVPSKIEKRIFSNPGAVIEDLVDHLVNDEDDPFMQVKLLHDWVTDNIAYDTEAFFSGNIAGTSWEDTLRMKSSVCQGYSELFNKMCTLAGIESTIITGYARGYDDDPFAEEDFSDSNHAWNGVKIDGFWYLVDCTWDAGYVNGTDFEKKYSTSYLFIRPEHNIFTHYPDNPSWQLLDSPVAAAELDGRPPYSGAYFQYGFDPFPGVGRANRAEDTFRFSFPLTPGIRLFADLSNKSGRSYQNYCFIQYQAGTAEVSVRFPAPGEWLVSLYAAAPGKDEYSTILGIGVAAANGSGLLYPVLYTPFIEEECYLYSPLESPLPAGSRIEFKMKLPGFKQILISTGEDSFTFNRGPEDVFTGEITIPRAEELTVYGSKEEDGHSFSGLVGYEIERE